VWENRCLAETSSQFLAIGMAKDSNQSFHPKITIPISSVATVTLIVEQLELILLEVTLRLTNVTLKRDANSTTTSQLNRAARIILRRN
jgi:hypothetical protein